LDIYETPVGFKYIGQKMRETTVLIGGRIGWLKRDWAYSRKDGILADMLVAIATKAKR